MVFDVSVELFPLVIVTLSDDNPNTNLGFDTITTNVVPIDGGAIFMNCHDSRLL